MDKPVTIVGLDVHKETIVVAVLPPRSERVTEALTLENLPKNVEKLVNRLALRGEVEFVYEAGPCGYEVQRQISKMGHRCVVIAPGLTPTRPGDRVKTDRRDAEKLARLYRAGELTEIRVPTRDEEAARDLLRAREDALVDRLRAQHRLTKFLLRQGRVNRGVRAWSWAYKNWLKVQKFDLPYLQQTFESYMRTLGEAQAHLDALSQQVLDIAENDSQRLTVKYLRCLKGVDTLGALTMALEAQEFRRFGKPTSFMGYTGLVGSERSSGGTVRRGGITKVGNPHLRRIMVEAAWNYKRSSCVSRELRIRRKDCPEEVVRIAQKAQDRLHRKFGRLLSRGKPAPVSVIAVARELAGFVWAIAQHVPVPAEA